MTDPTPLPPRRRIPDTVDEAVEDRMSESSRRLDAREMDQLAKDARNILSKAVLQPDAQIATRETHGPLSDIVGVPDRTLGGNTDEAYRRTPPQKSIHTPRELNDLGRMSAEAVNEQYEAAAKAFEDMAPEVKQRVASIAGALLELDADLKTIAEMAAAIRDKGKRVQLQIEEASALSNDIRDAALDVKKRLGL